MVNIVLSLLLRQGRQQMLSSSNVIWGEKTKGQMHSKTNGVTLEVSRCGSLANRLSPTPKNCFL